MKNKHLLFLLLLSSFFMACVDNKYDLGEVESDGLIIGEGWKAPLGKGSVNTEDVINLEDVPSVKVIDGIYTMEYSGDLVIDRPRLPDFRAVDRQMLTIAYCDIFTGEMGDLFNDKFNLAVTDPRLKLEGLNLESGSLDCQLEIVGKSTKGQVETVSTVSDFTVTPLVHNVWCSPIDPKKQDYMFVENKELPDVISIVPEVISLGLKADPAQWIGLPIGELETLSYSVEIPFIPAKEFYAESSELLKDAFNSDLIDRVFNSGSVTIFGLVTNEMPFNLKLGMTILNQDMQSVGIELEPQDVSGKEGEVSFKFNEQDLEKMKNAKHIRMDFYLSGREISEPLKPGQKIAFDLKLEKTGGITI